MRATFAWSASETSTLCASLRLVFVSFDVRMWRIFDWPRLNLPVPVFLKRLAAPRWVLSLGMVILLRNAVLRTGFSLQDESNSVQAHSAPNCVTQSCVVAEPPLTFLRGGSP